MDKNKVLILEDDHVSLLLVKKILETKYEVFTATNVEKSLSSLRENKFDAIVSDFMLPDGNALDLLNYINQQKIEVPVIILTKFSDTKNMSACWQGGAFDFVEKPVKREFLLEIVAMALEFPPPYRTMNTTFREKIGTMVEPAILNIDEILQRFDGDKELINQVLTVARNALTQFKLFLTSQGEQVIPSVADMSYQFHHIEGATLTISADRFSQCISRLSKAMKRGESLVMSDLHYLDKQLDLLIDTIDKMLTAAPDAEI